LKIKRNWPLLPYISNSRYTVWRFFQLCCYCCLIISNSYAATTNTSEKSEQLNRLNQQIVQLQTKLGQSKDKHSLLTRELQQTETNIGQFSRQLTTTEEALAEKQVELAQLQQEVRDQQTQLESEQALLGEQLRVFYQLGESNYMKLLLSQQDPNNIARLSTYYGYINLARNELIASLHVVLDKLAANRRKIEQETQQLATLQQQQQEQEQQLATDQSYHQAIIQQLNTDIQSQDEILQTLLANKAALEGLITRLEQATKIPSSKPFADMRKQLPWPAHGTLLTEQSLQYSVIQYSGIFIAAPEGEAVRAIYPGQVVFANWLRGFGLLMIIDHGQGYMSLYAHNQSLYKDEGDPVDMGDLIATIGNSGGNQQNGLYFEIRQNGKILNLLDWLKSEKG